MSIWGRVFRKQAAMCVFCAQSAALGYAVDYSYRYYKLTHAPFAPLDSFGIRPDAVDWARTAAVSVVGNVWLCHIGDSVFRGVCTTRQAHALFLSTACVLASFMTAEKYVIRPYAERKFAALLARK